MGWLDGRVALVVGGGSGIGRGVVEAFVREGASVGILDICPKKLANLEKLGATVKSILGDATVYEENERAVAQVVDTFGKLDILVCCAGLWDGGVELPGFPAEKIDEAFDEIFSVNVKSNILSAKAALPELLKNEGNIVLTGSNASFYPNGGGPLYTATKFAVRGLVTELAYELAPKVRVNGVAPGGTITALKALRSLDQGGFALDDDPNLSNFLQTGTPLQVAGTPESHSWAYVYLSSKESTRNVTGMMINSDGGISSRGVISGKIAGLL
ncbi:3-(cis-5,6-dihydroxycyclohexa-1,3-dien-1-yl)propanoate dehydrogenase [Brevibacillus sp. NRS-1366]|uniref:3-(cis-5,6-dihydroxycyclohexa-1, 3-dien-1-yl)propanoate dehydrogenase n=1 Tax=Brevibacillus sp. NRS-1366 TaxID=3233899 RepID=UPI003D1F3D1D